MENPSKASDSLPTRPSLLAAALGAEPMAWQQLVTLYEPRMRLWCRTQGLDETATADVLQEVWISVARGLSSFRSQPGAGAFRAWLHQIVRRRIADLRRRQGGLESAVGGSTFAVRLSELAQDDALSAPTEAGLPMTGLQRAMECVQRDVDPKTWQAFWRCVVDQRATEEVARELGMTPANVRQCRSRMLRRLRQAMEG
ncbi:MAG: RNA polymerase sigma factor [Pirellula sp.]